MTRLTKAQANEIRVLQKMKDEEIDFTDIPLTSDWSKSVVGTLYRRSGSLSRYAAAPRSASQRSHGG